MLPQLLQLFFNNFLPDIAAAAAVVAINGADIAVAILMSSLVQLLSFFTTSCCCHHSCYCSTSFLIFTVVAPFKNVNNCLNTNIYSYLETSCG
jgi:hypothetical protein